MRLSMRAAILIPVIAVVVRVAGIRHAAGAVLTMPRGVRGVRPLRIDEARAARIARAVHRVARVLPASCLTRAAVIGRLLTREGLEASITVGVARAPFAAHAWVEHGSLMLAGASPARDYAPLCRIDAGPSPVFTETA